MTHISHLLLLAGAGEAREIAHALAAQSRFKVTASLHYPERVVDPLPVPTRVGQFGGEAAFDRFLSDQGIDAVLDATHPFAAQISFRSQRLCGARAIPFAQVLRPEWRPETGDTWVDVANETQAAEIVPPGARVFTTTGRDSLRGFRNMHADHLFVRQLNEDPERKPVAKVTYISGTPPFSVQQEVDLFQDLKIDWLVVRNAGGEASRSKLDAARVLGLPVAMIRRPQQPPGAKLETAKAALDWALAL
jgi:precorrin-6A/cobalt-precorrin-6A reductase